MSADLKRDLQLASTSPTLRINPDEIAPQAKQELAVRPKAALHGPKVVRTSHPTVKASAKPAEVAEIPTEVPQVQVMASAPAPSETPSADAPPLARPSAIPAQSYPSAGPGQSSSAGGGSSGGVMSGIWGAIIRGGVVGDDDHCDPRGPRRTGRPIGGDVSGPYGRPGGMSFPGGMGRSRFP
ncbi:MAG TPA: hypothetical protein VGM50_09110 [Gemmatimonadaceae bacterium]